MWCHCWADSDHMGALMACQAALDCGGRVLSVTAARDDFFVFVAFENEVDVEGFRARTRALIAEMRALRAPVEEPTAPLLAQPS